MINSKKKGAEGERQWAEFLRENGFTECRRGQQYNGLEGEDVVGLDYIHNEVKRVERLNLYEAYEQAENDAKDKMPIVAHRKNRKHWLVTEDAYDFLILYRCYLIMRNKFESINQNPSMKFEEWIKLV